MRALDIDFLRQRPTVPPLAWLLLLAGAIGMALVLLDAAAARDELQAAQEQLERRQRIARAGQPARPARAVALSAEQQRAGERLEAALDRPWGPLLADLETLACDRVALIGLELQADGQRLRLVGEARQMADVVAYVRRLRALPSTRRASLSAHEQRQEGNVALVRFTVDAQWGGGAP
jgi:Tfp pilus assembly protein PilN